MENLVALNLPPEQKIEFLNKLRWMRHLSDSQVAQLANFIEAYEAANGTVVLSEGKKIQFFGIICDGEVNILKENTVGDGKMVKTFSAGNLLGVISFFDEGTCSASAIVQQHATLLIMDKKQFEAFCREAPEAALQVTLHLTRMLCQNLREMTARWADAI